MTNSIAPDHSALANDIAIAEQANNIGMAALRDGAPNIAIPYFERACALDPLAGPLWRNLATAYRASGQDEDERRALDGALDCDRTDFVAWLRKAELHERLGEMVPALTAWSGVIQLSAQFDPVPDGLVAALEHGRNFIETTNAHINKEIEGGIRASIEKADRSDARRMRSFADAAFGKRRIFQNECSGLHYPFLPADEFFDEALFPWLSTLEAKTDQIRTELAQLLTAGVESLRPYVQMEKGTPDSKWSALDHSLDWTACFLWEYGAPNDAVLERCPVTKSVVEALPRAVIPGRTPNVFFSILRPHSRIPPHTGVSNTRAIVHLPLIVPDHCGFRVGGETRVWEEGKAFVFDDTIEHEAWNDSDEPRAILIFDVWNPHLSTAEQQMIAQFYAETDRAGLQGEIRQH